MKQPLLGVLAIVNGVLLLSIVLSWRLGEQGWGMPAAQRPDPSELRPVEVRVVSPAPGALRPVLERPLFAATRRPADTAEELAPGTSDPFASASILGWAGRGRGGSAIVKVDGEVRRLQFGQRIGRWTLEGIDGTRARFRHDRGEIRMLPLNRASHARPTATMASSPSREADSGGEAVGRRLGTPDANEHVPPSAAPITHKTIQQRIAERRARREAMEARRSR